MLYARLIVARVSAFWVVPLHLFTSVKTDENQVQAFYLPYFTYIAFFFSLSLSFASFYVLSLCLLPLFYVLSMYVCMYVPAPFDIGMFSRLSLVLFFSAFRNWFLCALCMLDVLQSVASR